MRLTAGIDWPATTGLPLRATCLVGRETMVTAKKALPFGAAVVTSLGSAKPKSVVVKA